MRSPIRYRPISDLRCRARIILFRRSGNRGIIAGKYARHGKEKLMKTNRFLLIAVTALAVIFNQTTSGPLHAQTPAASALVGQITSAEEGSMEGVVVSAKRDGSTISVSVVTNAQGRFAFPAARLEPGHYTLKARAAGYELDGACAADVASGQEAKAEIKLRKVKNLSASLTNAEWLVSMPGTDEQKRFLLNCTGCHTLERIMKSTHDAVLDREGSVWYSDFGQMFLGKMDPKTGKVTQYPIPIVKPGWPEGTLDLELDKDDNPWVGVMYQNAIAKFDRKAEKFQIWSTPKEWDTDGGQLGHLAIGGTDVDNK